MSALLIDVVHMVVVIDHLGCEHRIFRHHAVVAPGGAHIVREPNRLTLWHWASSSFAHGASAWRSSERREHPRGLEQDPEVPADDQRVHPHGQEHRSIGEP